VRIAVTGANGQLGRAITAVLAGEHTLIALDRTQADLAAPDLDRRIAALNVDLVIHSAAHTDVDGCARDPDLAYRLNGLATRAVALGCRRSAARLIYISTNEVFAGDGSRPYREYDSVRPINAYGFSKAVGEQAVRELVPEHYIVRVSWLFGGPRNFVRTVLRLAAGRPAAGLRMVADEVGSPTYAADVAAALPALIASEQFGTYHLVNEGSCSRCELAQTTLALAGIDLPVTAISAAEFPRASTPPPYAPLANLAGAAAGIRLPQWTDALERYLLQLRADGLLA
jgi:dTDP-4-dehydrorhamnose reductase